MICKSEIVIIAIRKILKKWFENIGKVYTTEITWVISKKLLFNNCIFLMYTHTRTTCSYARTQARLKQRRGSDCAQSPTWRQEGPPLSLSAAIREGITLRGQASSPIARPRGTTDNRRTTTTNSSSSNHHDSAPPRLQPLICGRSTQFMARPSCKPRRPPPCHFGGFSFSETQLQLSWEQITDHRTWWQNSKRHTYGRNKQENNVHAVNMARLEWVGVPHLGSASDSVWPCEGAHHIKYNSI